MQNKLKDLQPVVYQVLSNCFKNNKLSHAIMLSGAKTNIKLETAYYIAQSLVCEISSDFACGVCDSCTKITNQSYADFKYFDGTNVSIKKDDILNLQKQFNKTGIEKSGKKIYIINAAENMTIEAGNSLLKFLEEPSSENMIAIFIVDNLDKMLTTITSRCQIINFKPNDRQSCIDEAISLNVDEFDAKMISNYVKDANGILLVSESESYQNALCMFNEFNNDLFMLERVLVSFQTNYMNNKELAKDMLAQFINIFCTYLDDYLLDSVLLKDKYVNINRYLDKNQMNFAMIYTILLETQGKIYRPFDLNLVVDQMFYELQEVIK